MPSDRAGFDHHRTVRAEAEVRRKDPHGTRPCARADQGEPTASPSSDRHRAETTVARVGQDGPEPRGTMDTRQERSSRPARVSDPMDLPAPGYPHAELALTAWFRETRGREPSEREIGALMAAMAARDTATPHD